jgi:hypothetical protein
MFSVCSSCEKGKHRSTLQRPFLRLSKGLVNQENANARGPARDAPRFKPLLRERRRFSRDPARIWVSVDLEQDRKREFEAFPGPAEAAQPRSPTE